MSVTMSIRTTKGSILRPGWKSALDITCILLSLPVWLPLMILLMLVTRIASPGPIFYRQERIGFGGRHFFIWKFRTMKLSAETQVHERHFEELMRVDCPMTKLDVYGDPRLAPFGRILRASGLDELPQIFNVLRGEMSLVGPRPCTPNEFAHYEPWQRERVNGLPGLTGYWQVNGSRQSGNRRSPTTTISKFPSVLLLAVSTAAAQFQSWLLETASSVWYLVRSLCSRVEHAAVALVTLLLALCQQGKVPQQAGALAEQAGELAERTFATSLVATSFVTPALTETTNFHVDMQHVSPPPPVVAQTRKGKFGLSANAKRSLSRAQTQHQKAPALRIGRAIDREWHRLVAARKSVHSAFARLIRDANPQQSKQRHRKQRLN